MKNKRGQFYLIAAIIIIIVVSGITGVVTYASANSKPKAISDLSNDLEEESSRIVDYGIYNNQNITDLIYNFSDSAYAPYFLQKTNNANVIIVYGNKTNLDSVQYRRAITGTVSTTLGGQVDWEITSPYTQKADVNVNPNDNKVQVQLLNRNFTFDLRDNQMFYFLIVNEKNGEVYVEKNK